MTNALQNFIAAHSWVDLALLAFIALAMPAMSLMAGRQLSREAQSSLIPRYWFTLARGLLAAGVLLFAWYWLGRPFAALGLDVPVNLRGQIGFAFVAAAAVLLGFNLWRIRKISGARLDNATVSLGRLKIVPRTKAELAVFLLVAINAGFWEELLYRGFLLWLLIPAAGVAGAIAISSILFGLGHVYQGWRGVLATGSVGLVFALFYAFTRSLWWVMAAHALIDIHGGFVSYQLRRMLARRSPIAQPVG
ncbi:MAG TPA: CPBP family intramembrane glutamic endopeptidase [Rhizomicrobium sp.]|jgi:membrane protease YdiL (CAAX protease family)|nr:CPBP family intramembrane glutamic endopeptidase [Rhizomicrobium sp.]